MKIAYNNYFLGKQIMKKRIERKIMRLEHKIQDNTNKCVIAYMNICRGYYPMADYQSIRQQFQEKNVKLEQKIERLKKKNEDKQ